MGKSLPNRPAAYTVRTTQMSDEMYRHVEKMIEGRTFKEYVFELIQKEMYNQTILTHMEQLIALHNTEIVNKLQELKTEIKGRSFVPGIDLSGNSTREETEDKSEEQIVPKDIEIRSSINPSEFNVDF